MAKRRLAALLMYDLEDSTRRINANKKDTQKKLRQIRKQIAQPAVTRGNILKSTGDGAIITFSTVHEAAELALALARQAILPLRLSITLGDLDFVGGDVETHEAISTADRLQKAALPPGTILVNQAVAEQLYRTHVVQEVGEKDLDKIGPVAAYSITAGEPGTQDRTMFRSAAVANEELNRLLQQRDAEIKDLEGSLKLSQTRLKNTRRMLLLTRALRTFEQQLPQCEQRYAEALEVETRFKADNEPDWLEEMMNIQNRWQMQHADVIADAYQEIGEPVPPFPTRYRYRKLPLSYDRKFFDEAPAFHDAVRKSINSVQREIGQLRGKVH